MHLWEIEHESFGPSLDDDENTCESFTELRAEIDALWPEINQIYRWDWCDWSQPHHDGLFVDGEDRSGQGFYVYLVIPRKDRLISFACPITHEQEDEVLAWLRSDRVLGSLKRSWAPLLDA